MTTVVDQPADVKWLSNKNQPSINNMIINKSCFHKFSLHNLLPMVCAEGLLDF